MRHRIKVIVATLFMLTQFSGVAQGMSQPSKFSSCKSVLSVYPSGIAKNKVSAGLYPAKISAPLYQANKKFDFDKDGIICEKEIVQSALTTTTTTTTTTTLPGMSSGSTPPSGVWEDTSIRDTKELSFGKGYRFVQCAGGTLFANTKFEVQNSGQWITKAIAKTSTPSSICKNTAFPILHSYYWIVDVAGSESKTYLNVRLTGFTSATEAVRIVSKTQSTSVITPITGTTTPSSGSSPAPAAPTTSTTVFSPSETTIFGRPFLSNGYWILPNIENAPGFTSIQAFVGGSWVTVGFSASSSSFGIQASVPDTFGFNVAFRHIREVYSVTTGRYEIVQIWNRSGSSGY